MNTITRSIMQIFKGAGKALKTFPATIICALAFAIVTMIRIQLDWPEQQAYNFLFNCLHWSFAVGSIFSLAVITLAKSRFDHDRAFLIANLLGAAVVIITFISLYLSSNLDTTSAKVILLSELATARVTAAILVSFLAFILFAGYPKEHSDFARSLFMTQKAFFIALIYGAVIMGGASGVAGAVQALLYREMSSKVYMYIGTIAGFLAFTIFVGYFPDFRKRKNDERREIAQKQPRFVEILFGYIMIPIVLTLMAVLLIWAGKTVLSGMGSSFTTLAGIASSYTLGGIWLYMMVTHYDSGLAKFYKRIYPITALVILIFEVWALFVQLNKSGLKTEEYFFILIWIIAVTAAVLLLAIKSKSYAAIIILTCAFAVVSVLPAVGYQSLPVAAQVRRLENLLISQGMLNENQLISKTAEPEKAVREQITDAVTYLAHIENAKLPVWFDKNLTDNDVFKSKLGFEQTWPEYQKTEPYGNMGTSLSLPDEAIDISGYQWSVPMKNMSEMKEVINVTINGKKGLYKIDWTISSKTGIPSLKIKLNDNVIIEQDMKDYVERVAAAYPPGKTAPSKANIKDMCMQLDSSNVTVLLVFSNININVDARNDAITYWLNLNALYIKEKP